MSDPLIEYQGRRLRKRSDGVWWVQHPREDDDKSEAWLWLATEEGVTGLLDFLAQAQHELRLIHDAEHARSDRFADERDEALRRNAELEAFIRACGYNPDTIADEWMTDEQQGDAL